ncbi:putative phosphatase regulatory subunit domain-containing protein [Rhizoctonia solani AG-1 IA]|uniref:Putative phosphatase regulatory subunit domain-containing protein n=1 Tax=Thanatephorus cucumeris (strain AG1-IA) TaxID=983506 RepID=L8WGT7_THACA|nr:putative phosphatase regulatory subunit domain-containing protein [Rhizoctonia solani AG-1 IA]
MRSSSTSDCSFEGEGNEFPWYGRGNAGAGAGYGSSDDERARKALRVKNTNVPANASIEGADIRVQSLTLSEDGSSLVGRVLVRNLAYEKWVAARFTFDWWQTTSEVSARYIDTVGDGIDRFGFTIKLGDVLHRIEEKTLFVAVRYTVSGREIWDSNNGQNYMVSFTKERESAVTTTTNGWNSGWSAKSRSRDQMSDLRKSLERAMQDDDDSIPQLQIKSRPRPSVRGMSFSGFEAKKPTVASIVAEVKPAPPKLGSRYDFGAAPRQRPCADAFRMPELKQGSDAAAPKRNVRTHEKRPSVSTEVRRDISEAKLCESPRDAEDGMLRLRMAPVEPLVRSGGLDLPSPAEPVAVAPRRHHHRAAYFDAWSFPAPGVKRTCSGAPADEPTKDMIPASWMDGTDLFVNRDVLGGSVASTPSVTSASSPSQSPSSPPEFLPSPDIVEADLGKPLSMPMPGQIVVEYKVETGLRRPGWLLGGDCSYSARRLQHLVQQLVRGLDAEGRLSRVSPPLSIACPSQLSSLPLQRLVRAYMLHILNTCSRFVCVAAGSTRYDLFHLLHASKLDPRRPGCPLGGFIGIEMISNPIECLACNVCGAVVTIWMRKGNSLFYHVSSIMSISLQLSLGRQSFLSPVPFGRESSSSPAIAPRLSPAVFVFRLELAHITETHRRSVALLWIVLQ